MRLTSCSKCAIVLDVDILHFHAIENHDETNDLNGIQLECPICKNSEGLEIFDEGVEIP